MWLRSSFKACQLLSEKKHGMWPNNILQEDWLQKHCVSDMSVIPEKWNKVYAWIPPAAVQTQKGLHQVDQD